MSPKVTKKSPRSQPLNIILLGDFAAGKATQARLLQKTRPLLDFDMGEEQAKRRLQDKTFDAVLRKTVDQGKLTPTQWPKKILREVLTKTPNTHGIIFDGHPKMPGEARYLVGLLKKYGRSRVVFLYLTVPQKESLLRISKRTGYHSGKKIRRADDEQLTFQKRIRFVKTSIQKVVPYFRRHFPYAHISGLGTPEEVQQKILRAIKRLDKWRVT